MNNLKSLRNTMLARTIIYILDNSLGTALLTFAIVILCHIGESRKRSF